MGADNSSIRWIIRFFRDMSDELAQRRMEFISPTRMFTSLISSFITLVIFLPLGCFVIIHENELP